MTNRKLDQIRVDLGHVAFYSQQSRIGMNRLFAGNNLRAFTTRGSNQIPTERLRGGRAHFEKAPVTGYPSS